MDSAIFAFLLLFLLFVYLLKLITKNGGKLNLPPSPPKLPIIGNLHQLGTLPHRAMQSLSAKYGALMLLHFGSAPTVVVSSPELARAIITTHDVNLSDRPPTMAGDILFCRGGDVAFCQYGEYWRQAKKICVVELLSQKRVQEFKFAREEEIANMVEKIQNSCLDAAAIDVSDMIINVTNNIISRSALGGVYANGDRDVSLGGLSRRAQDLLGSFCFKDVCSYLGWVDVVNGFVGNLKKVSKELHDFLDRVIVEHEAKGLMSNGDKKSNKKDIVDILLYLQKHGNLGIQLTRENIIAILMDMFLGGTDTSGTTLEWAMAELVKNPTIMKRAQEEVRRVIGSKSKVEESDLDQMKYLKCILKESLRLHAPAMIPRKTMENIKLAGYDIPAKTTVLINTWAIQRDPKTWDRPEEFIPERFSEISIDYRGQHGQLLPFGAGRRGCPGLSFAIAEAELVLANLLCWFDWKLADGSSGEALDMSEKYGLAVRKKIPLVLVPTLH